MQELNLIEIKAVNGGVTNTQVLAIGAGVTAVGAATLAAVSSPILLPALGAYGLAAGLFALGAALNDAGFGGFLRHSLPN